MIIYKMDSFWTDEDRAELKRLQDKFNVIHHTTRILTQQANEERAKNKDYSLEGEPLKENLQGLKEVELQLAENEIAIEGIYSRVRQRYFDSYKDNPEAIYTAIQEVLDAYELEDFTRIQRRNAENYKVFHSENEETNKVLKQSVRENYTNCFSHIYRIVSVELLALGHYGLSLEKAEEMIEEKARSYYPKRTAKKKKLTIADIEKEARSFHTIRQGNTTNALAKFGERDMEIDQFTNKAIFRKGEITLEIPNYDKIRGLKTSTQQLLDIICINLTESGAKSPTVSFPLEEYMAKRGLKDRKEARNQIKADLELLQQANIKAEQRKRGNTVYYEFINIADSGKIENGYITFTFGTSFYNMLLSYPVMPYPAKLLQINGNKNPNSSPFGRKIAEHKNMNVGKPNENIIAVKTLLEVSKLPTYEEVMKGNKNVTNRIITPFERDLDALADIFKWHYCHTNGSPLSDNELPPNYETFKELLIFIEWNEYPDQTERLKRKRERIEQGKKTAQKKNANK